MYLALILGIVDKILDLALQFSKDMPPEQKAAAWAQYQKNLDFWQGIVDRLTAKE